MRFGVCLPNYGPATSPAAIQAVADLAEAAGYDSVWATDHLLVPAEHADTFGHVIEALLTLGYLAGRSKRLTLATSILVLPQRDPIVVAKQVAALDLLSNGRCLLGVGAGWMAAEFAYLRAPFESRGRRLDEWIDCLRALWRGDKTFQGEWVRFEDAAFAPLPHRPGGPPIVVGGNSRAALRRTAVRGDGWHPTGIDPEDLAAGVRWLREQTERPLSISLRSQVRLGGEPLPVRETAGGRRLAISGPPAAIVDTIGRFGAAGLDHLVCYFRHDTVGELLAQMEQFAAAIRPAFSTHGDA